MVNSRLLPLPALSDNYIWLFRQDDNAIVVDPGEAEPVEQYLEQHGLTLQAILLTHHHGDHVGGALALHNRSNAPVYGPAGERLPVCHHRLSEGDTVQLRDFGLTLSVLDVPGHTAGHIAYHGRPASGAPMLFCGDTLFAAGCGRLFEGTPQQMLESLSKFRNLPGESLVCCAHEYTLSNLRWALQVEPGNAALQERFAHATELREQGLPTLPSTLALEWETNPFLRTAVTPVAESAAQNAGSALRSEVEVFAQLREWKNNFK
ncbi:MAG TPA: hydroxyacylglutathione hydrolase [Burkholderiaceae bacterium]|jgi:hydroxyacylglutathione hydrolase|nr:hydroxyacylglutathione hydrolase [Burkholderiaceae bacterium]